MDAPIEVKIIGAPVACAEGVKDSWRSAAGWVARQLARYFGDIVQVRYYDLFDADCPSLPPDAQLPLVLVNGEVFSSGEKLRVPALRRKIESILQAEHGV